MANKYSAKCNPYQTFSLPESFDALDILPPDLHDKADEANYVISLLIFKASHQFCEETEGFIRLNSTILNQVMDNRVRCRILDCLLAKSVIECDGTYVPGAKSLGYRLHPRFADDRVKKVAATNRRISKKLDRFYEEKLSGDNSLWLPVHHRLNEEQYKLDIDLEHAEDIIANLTPKKKHRTAKKSEYIARNSRLCQLALVSTIARKQHQQSVGSTGRLYNCITSLKREIRPALKYNGKSLECVDIRNSQPALLAKLVNDSLGQQQIELPEDVVRYIDLTSKGEFYKYIYEVLDKAIPLDEIKRKFLTDIFAKKRWVEAKSGILVPRDYRSNVEDAFKREFPTIYRFICETNQENAELGITLSQSHSVLIRKLQEIEAKLVIEDTVVRAFAHPSKPLVLTLHDALVCGAGESGIIDELLHQAAKDEGCQIATKIDHW